MSDIPICVLTCDKYLWMLRPFALLFNTFWDNEQEVRIYGYKPNQNILKDLPDNFNFHSINKNVYPVKRWSDGLIEMIDDLKSDYFILFLEDYWLYTAVNQRTVELLTGYAPKRPKVLRVDLSNERASKKNAKIIENYKGINIIEIQGMAKFSMSFQVGIWNSELMLSILRRGESPWDSELRGTERVNELYGTVRILGTDSRPVEYQPVYRIHKQQLTTNKIPTHLINEIRERGWLRRRIR
jgi:hypothetical protein